MPKQQEGDCESLITRCSQQEAADHTSDGGAHVEDDHPEQEHSPHLSLGGKVKRGIREHIECSRSSAKYADPFSSPILRIEQDISTHNGYTSRYNRQYDKYQQHEPIDIIKLVIPKRVENLVRCNEDSSKW